MIAPLVGWRAVCAQYRTETRYRPSGPAGAGHWLRSRLLRAPELVHGRRPTAGRDEPPTMERTMRRRKPSASTSKTRVDPSQWTSDRVTVRIVVFTGARVLECGEVLDPRKRAATLRPPRDPARKRCAPRSSDAPRAGSPRRRGCTGSVSRSPSVGHGMRGRPLRRARARMSRGSTAFKARASSFCGQGRGARNEITCPRA